MDKRAKIKRTSITFEKGDLTEAHRHLFKKIVWSERPNATKGELMGKAIELLAKELYGEMSATQSLNNIRQRMAEQEDFVGEGKLIDPQEYKKLRPVQRNRLLKTVKHRLEVEDRLAAKESGNINPTIGEP